MQKRGRTVERTAARKGMNLTVKNVYLSRVLFDPRQDLILTTIVMRGAISKLRMKGSDKGTSFVIKQSRSTSELFVRHDHSERQLLR